MNLSDLKRAAEHADRVVGNTATRLTDVHLRIRTARRRRAAVGAVAMAVTLALAGAVVGRSVLETADVKQSEPAYPAWLRVRPVKGADLLDLDHWSVDPRRLFEPESWLPATAFIDARYRPYVPTTYSFCSTASSVAGSPPPVVDSLPADAARLLRSRPWRPAPEPMPLKACTTMTTDEARMVVGILENEWLRSDYAGPPIVFDVGLHQRKSSNVTGTGERTATFLAIEPVLPDNQLTCNCA